MVGEMPISVAEAVGIVYGGGIALFLVILVAVLAVEDTKRRVNYGSVLLPWGKTYAGQVSLEKNQSLQKYTSQKMMVQIRK